MSTVPVIVYGEGSAAVFLISCLVRKGEHVVWAAGSGAKLNPVMPFVTSELAMATLVEAQNMISEENFTNAIEKGLFHRVFRNKGFKLPAWKKSASKETQKEAFEELVWAPEQAYVGLQEIRLAGTNPSLIERGLRELFEGHPLITKVSTAPVIELEVFEDGGKIQFANGFITEFKQFFYCDSLMELKSIPKLLTVMKHQLGNVKASGMMSALQVVFTHSEPLNQTIEAGLMIPLNRDAGENFDRDTMGYFIAPNKSAWTVFLQPEEVEENHEIMKKLRKIKQALNKAFDGPEFLPEGKKEFMQTVEKEQVHFEESFIAVNGHFKESSANSDFVLLSDSFGLSAALEKIAERFELEAIEFNDEESISIDPSIMAPLASDQIDQHLS